MSATDEARERVTAFVGALREIDGDATVATASAVVAGGLSLRLTVADLRALIAVPCPYVVTADGGTQSCSLAAAVTQAPSDPEQFRATRDELGIEDDS